MPSPQTASGHKIKLLDGPRSALFPQKDTGGSHLPLQFIVAVLEVKGSFATAEIKGPQLTAKR